MALNENATVLFIAYYYANCVIAWDVATMQLIWKTEVPSNANCVVHHDGQLLVGAFKSVLFVLDAADGSVVRQLPKVSDNIMSIAVFPGLSLILHAPLAHLSRRACLPAPLPEITRHHIRRLSS